MWNNKIWYCCSNVFLLQIRCNNRIFPKIDDRTGKQSIRMDLIGDIEDTDRLVTTKMLYQEVSFQATWNYSRPEIWTLTAVDMINVGSDYIVSFGSLRDYMRKHQYFIRH